MYLRLIVFLMLTQITLGNFICPEKPALAHYRDPFNCHGYIYCVRGQPHPGKCVGDRVYDTKTKSCVEHGTVPCKVGAAQLVEVHSATQRIPVRPVKAVFTQSTPDASVVNSGETPTEHPSCHAPGGLMGSPTTTTTTTASPTTPARPVIILNPLPGPIAHSFSCTDRPCGLYPNVNNCSSFILCSEGMEIFKHCNDGQLFDTRSLECHSAEKAQCWTEPVTGSMEILRAAVPICPFHNKSAATNSSPPQSTILSSPVVTNRGNWLRWVSCPPDTFANGIYIWRQIVQIGSKIDQAGTVSISLECANIDGTRVTNIEISAPGAPNEGWPAHFLCSGVGIGFRLNSQEDQGLGDDLGADNVDLMCSCGPSVHKPYENDSGLQSGNRGTWTEEQVCPPKTAVCAMQAQMVNFVRAEPAFDNTGLNNLKMKCCAVPDPLASCTMPEEKMQLIQKCENLEGDFQKRCDFSGSIGLDYDYSNIKVINFYESVGYSLGDSKVGLAMLFKTSLGKNSNVTTVYNWDNNQSNIWYANQMSTKSIYIGHNTTTELYQIVGSCLLYEIKTNWFMRIDTNIMNGQVETTYYEI